ncbi:hypothetical protein MUK42_20051 [Musa troglodytarum]|uniref:Uncharacterized protein n=1 Tax=Musa troglodytarum TaxID=320322 RepID=A0A9E7E8X1_9LILI|nr:hypothetical protein MUK42_20051 [Musa troglodytarum]
MAVFGHLFKTAGEACYDALELARSFLVSVLQYAVELLKDMVVSIISSLLEALMSVATGSLQLTTSAIAELLEESKIALGGLAAGVHRGRQGWSSKQLKAFGATTWMVSGTS